MLLLSFQCRYLWGVFRAAQRQSHGWSRGETQRGNNVLEVEAFGLSSGKYTMVRPVDICRYEEAAVLCKLDYLVLCDGAAGSVCVRPGSVWTTLEGWTLS